MNRFNCIRCNTEMNFFAKEQIQLGKTGWILGDLPNLIAGAIEVDIYICPKCQKLEFYATENALPEEPLPQKKCPECGAVHDFDYPKCPNCKHVY